MFGIGWPEILLIGIVAVLVIGPKDLPPLMRQAGRMARKGRAMWNELRQHWEDLPNQVGLDEMEREAEQLQKKINTSVMGDAEPMTGEDSLAPGSSKPKTGKPS